VELFVEVAFTVGVKAIEQGIARRVLSKGELYNTIREKINKARIEALGPGRKSNLKEE
jgi:hypothetical protein